MVKMDRNGGENWKMEKKGENVQKFLKILKNS